MNIGGAPVLTRPLTEMVLSVLGLVPWLLSSVLKSLWRVSGLNAIIGQVSTRLPGCIVLVLQLRVVSMLLSVEAVRPVVRRLLVEKLTIVTVLVL